MNYRILLVDADPATEAQLRGPLQDVGIELIVADDPIRGLEVFEETRPHLALIDTPQPSIEAFQFCQTCKQMQPDGEVPVLVVSEAGSSSLTDEWESILAEADACIARTLAPTEFVETCQRWLDRAHSEKSIAAEGVAEGEAADATPDADDEDAACSPFSTAEVPTAQAGIPGSEETAGDAEPSASFLEDAEIDAFVSEVDGGVNFSELAEDDVLLGDSETESESESLDASQAASISEGAESSRDAAPRSTADISDSLRQSLMELAAEEERLENSFQSSSGKRKSSLDMEDIVEGLELGSLRPKLPDADETPIVHSDPDDQSALDAWAMASGQASSTVKQDAAANEQDATDIGADDSAADFEATAPAESDTLQADVNVQTETEIEVDVDADVEAHTVHAEVSATPPSPAIDAAASKVDASVAAVSDEPAEALAEDASETHAVAFEPGQATASVLETEPYEGADEISSHLDSLFGGGDDLFGGSPEPAPAPPVAQAPVQPVPSPAPVVENPFAEKPVAAAPAPIATQVAIPSPFSPEDRPELIGIDEGLVDWDANSDHDQLPFGMIAESIPGAEPFTPLDETTSPEELAIHQLEQAARPSSNRALWAFFLLLLAVGIGATWMFWPKSADSAPTPSLELAGEPGPVPQTRIAPQQQPSLFDARDGEPALLAALDAQAPGETRWVAAGALPSFNGEEAIAASTRAAPEPSSPASPVVNKPPTATPSATNTQISRAPSEPPTRSAIIAQERPREPAREPTRRVVTGNTGTDSRERGGSMETPAVVPPRTIPTPADDPEVNAPSISNGRPATELQAAITPASSEQDLPAEQPNQQDPTATVAPSLNLDPVEQPQAADTAREATTGLFDSAPSTEAPAVQPLVRDGNPSSAASTPIDLSSAISRAAEKVDAMEQRYAKMADDFASQRESQASTPRTSVASAEGLMSPQLVERPQPKFERVDLDRHRGSELVLRVRVDAAGKVTRVIVERGQREGPLTAAAIDAVLRSTYQPATMDGVQVDAWTVERFRF